MKLRYLAPARHSGPRFGKRTRRAMIRLRHSVARERFERWLDRAQGLSGDFYKPHKTEARLWHEWHALGAR